MIKLLITTGCSFTQYPGSNVSWSYHLSKSMNVETLFLGHGAASNGIISKKTIFNTLDALKKYKPEEILVMVMWSTHDRKTFFLDRYQADIFIDDWRNHRDSYNVCAQFSDMRGEFKSPITIEHVENNLTKTMRASHTSGWLNLHNSHANSFEKLYYQRIHNLTYGINLTLENILLLSMLCNKYNVKFVYSFIMENIINNMLDDNDEINKHLVDEVLNYPFIRQSPFDYLRKFNDKSLFREDGVHPNLDGHRKFVEDVMLPWIEKTYPGLLST